MEKKTTKVNGLSHLINVPARLRVFAAFSDSFAGNIHCPKDSLLWRPGLAPVTHRYRGRLL